MPQGRSSVMYCLHCRFQVAHHIGSDSNPNLSPEFPGRLLHGFVQLFFAQKRKILPNFIVSVSRCDEFISAPSPI